MNFLIDSHIHSSFSGDSNMDIELIIKKAKETHLTGIAITDHVDIDFPNYNPAFNIDLEKYTYFYDKIKLKYQDEFKVIKGIEIGLQEHVADKNKSIVQKYTFDFVIASIHVVDKLDLNNGDFTKGKTKKHAYERFFEVTLNNLNLFDDYDVLGHFDFIRRYGDYENNILILDDYKGYIDDILKHIIKQKKGLEVNTSGFKYKLNSSTPDYDVLKRYKELGGEIVTIGSDAHTYNYIGSNFSYVIQLLKKIGFLAITYFENRIPKFIQINDEVK